MSFLRRHTGTRQVEVAQREVVRLYDGWAVVIGKMYYNSSPYTDLVLMRIPDYIREYCQ